MKKFALAVVTMNTETNEREVRVLKSPRRNVLVGLNEGKKFKMFSTKETALQWVNFIKEDENSPANIRENVKVWDLKNAEQYIVPKMVRKARAPKVAVEEAIEALPVEDTAIGTTEEAIEAPAEEAANS